MDPPTPLANPTDPIQLPAVPPELLLFVFATHLPFFLFRWARSREIRYAATSVTFALLAIAYAIRVFAPQATIGGVSLFAIARVPAWAAAAVSIGLLLRHHARRLRGHMEGTHESG